MYFSPYTHTVSTGWSSQEDESAKLYECAVQWSNGSSLYR